MKTFKSLIFTLLTASVAIMLSAHPASASPVGGDLANSEAALSSKVFGEPETGAHASRRNRPRFMPMFKAKNNARYAAYQVYLDPEFNFDQYGTGKCRRLNRSKVYCYTWASEDFYDDFGYYLDTLLCDWFTTSTYNARGKMKIKIEQPECVWLSEV